MPRTNIRVAIVGMGIGETNGRAISVIAHGELC